MPLFIPRSHRNLKFRLSSNSIRFVRSFQTTMKQLQIPILMMISLFPYTGGSESRYNGESLQHRRAENPPPIWSDPATFNVNAGINSPGTRTGTITSNQEAQGLLMTGTGASIERPRFRSRSGQTYRIKLGDSVTMSCNLEKLGSSVIVWKQSDRIISAGERMIRKDPRMNLIQDPNGISLHIANTTPQDRGEYICEVETYGDPISQKNRLDVLVPPSVVLMNTGKTLRVRKDSMVTLACNASGYPIPVITWQREYQMLPTGEKEKVGPSLILHNVTRLDSGTYICKATNGVERAVQAKIQLEVIYEPEIQVDKNWVHADLNIEVEMSCVVHAVPQAEVKWYRDTMLLAGNENRFVENFGIRHSMVIRKVALEDFGNYSCAAENKLGRSRAFIEVAGNPNKPNISSQSMGYYSDRYNLTWTVFSYSEVTQYRILYRKVVPEGDPRKEVIKNRWHNVVPSFRQIFGNRGPPVQSGSYMFYALEPRSQYELMIQCKNKWGWSDHSEPFYFSTRSSDVSPKVDASQPKKDPESAAANDSPSNPKDSSVNKKSGRDFQTSSFDDFLGSKSSFASSSLPTSIISSSNKVYSVSLSSILIFFRQFLS